MRFFCLKLSGLVAITLMFLAHAQGPVIAQANGTQAAEQTDTAEPRSRDERLNDQFARLKREHKPESAKRIADGIWALWLESDSATANQLMAWANEAMKDDRHYMAMDLLDQVTVLVPEYAEGWNRRATLHYMMDNHSKSMADINRVLQLEPRHFGALMGMGAILSAAGRDEAALNAYLKVLEVYPAMREAQERVGKISDELAGDEI